MKLVQRKELAWKFCWKGERGRSMGERKEEKEGSKGTKRKGDLQQVTADSLGEGGHLEPKLWVVSGK